MRTAAVAFEFAQKTTTTTKHLTFGKAATLFEKDSGRKFNNNNQTQNSQQN